MIEESIWLPYCRFHDDGVAKLKAGASSQKTLTFKVYPPDSRGYSGGYCDRLMGAVFSYLVAVASRRLFFIDWPQPFELKSFAQPAYFDWTPQPNLLEGDIIDVDLVNDLWFKPDLREHFYSGDFDALFFKSSPHVNLYVNYFTSLPIKLVSDFIGGKPPKTEREFFSSVFNTLFTYNFNRHLATLYNEFSEARTGHPSSVGVHFRGGGGAVAWGDPELDSAESLAKIAAKIDWLIEDRGLINPLVLVCSDSQVFKQKLAGMLSAQTTYEFSHPIVHTERSGSLKIAAFGGYAVLEHRCLGDCDWVICGKGNFGRTAALRAGKQPIFYSSE